MELLIKTPDTPRKVLKSLEAAGRTRGRSAGGWVHDLCALRKVITLCPACTHKFNPGRLGYVREKEFNQVCAKCDGCTTLDMHCTMYMFEETYHLVRSTAAERRALARSREKRIAQGRL